MSDAGEEEEISDIELDDDFDAYAAVVDEDPGGTDDDEEAEEGAETAPPRAAIPMIHDDGGAPRDRAAPSSARPVYVVPDDERITSNIMTKAEVTRAIAIRAQQIANHLHTYIDKSGLTDAKEIARRELYDRRSPLVLHRVVGKTPEGARIVEKWRVREMTYPPLN